MWLSFVGTVTGITLSKAGRAGLAEVVPAMVFHLWIIIVTTRWPAWHHARGGTPVEPVGAPPN